jgi:hypothetical protein
LPVVAVAEAHARREMEGNLYHRLPTYGDEDAVEDRWARFSGDFFSFSYVLCFVAKI